ncbi:TlpA family protein disulfide reductase [Pedobacter metabolipauper]|uniref:Peroxiredoxin n=1 Tax=Pedobacter metabolipauper TaxID=425513 RepID=A0A4R6SPH6_9SPHI|nr:TlpA disulfide reductase family protein [Pedobacter metabolipauper]TDQ06481.1 peroxiredoxin [Pedobacter metabolipauper]
MKRTHLLLFLVLLPFVTLAQQDSTTLTKIGDQVPEFSFEAEKGKTVQIKDYKGKLILINLFATWCPPCNIELPLVQKQIWEKHQGNSKFAFFVFGREEGWDKLDPYKAKKGFTFPILPDLKREVFSKFATQSIPRNILIDEDGKIIYQSIGFGEQEFSEMVKQIDNYLSKSGKAK